MDARVREGRTEDLERIVEGNLAMALETEDLALDPEVLRPGVAAVLAGGVGAFYRVIGSPAQAQLMITVEWSDWRNRPVWWIQSVYVWPEYRGQGLYRRLYEQVIAEARGAGAGGVRLYVDQRNERAMKVYAHLGMDGEHYRVFEVLF